MSESNTHPNCRLPSCLNSNPFMRCTSCYFVWYCSLLHARIVSGSFHYEHQSPQHLTTRTHHVIVKNVMLLFWNGRLIQFHQLLYHDCLKKLISEHILTSLVRNVLYTFVGYFAFQRWYLKRYSWKVSTNSANMPSNRTHWDVGNPNDRVVVTQSNQDRWEKNVSRLTVVWDFVRMGGTLSVPYVPSI